MKKRLIEVLKISFWTFCWVVCIVEPVQKLVNRKEGDTE